ncbi:50S ribosome-binding GTPase [Fodinibacter luteus]|uniref:50S ribosome-binding GTPase n=1 Tax=Fodinibacter luteus TaxID=552064 RepID=A0ABP8KB91_9MICO
MRARRTSERARTLLDRGLDVVDDDDVRARLVAARDRLDEPIRVALAGRLKAGKSTLINAFLGEQVAPTDTGECTRVVTWYRGGASPRVRVVLRDGARVERPVHRVEGRLRLDTGGRPIDEVLRIEVTWPSPALSDLTLIDTPGLASLSEEISVSSMNALVPGGSASEVDAVVYLLRHLHASDADFLSAFREHQGAAANPATTLGVLSRADEVGAGRLDALLGAAKVAGRYRDDPFVRLACVDVVPVAGLLAEGARTMRQSEFEALRALSALGRERRENLLLSADRFARVPLEDPAASPEVRARLLDRFGVYGIRLATVLVRDGFGTASALADELVRRSGLDEVSRILTVQFAGRADALKARTALLTLHRELSARGPDLHELRDDVESALRDVHEHAEMRLLAELRTSHAPALGAPDLEEADRVLGGRGTSAAERLGTPAGMPHHGMLDAALAQLRHWRTVASDPDHGAAEIAAAHTVIRTLEGLVLELEEVGPAAAEHGEDRAPSLS